MQSYTLIVLAAIVAMALAEGQFYVPRAYYIIDAEGHESAPVPLRRLRRSLGPYPYPYTSGASANANANANSWGGGSADASANANANAGGFGDWGVPGGRYGAVRAGQTVRQSGPVVGGRSVSASSSVGLDSSGRGYYDQYTSVSK